MIKRPLLFAALATTLAFGLALLPLLYAFVAHRLGLPQLPVLGIISLVLGAPGMLVLFPIANLSGSRPGILPAVLLDCFIYFAFFRAVAFWWNHKLRTLPGPQSVSVDRKNGGGRENE